MRSAGHERQPSVPTTSLTPSAQTVVSSAAHGTVSSSASHGATIRKGAAVEPEVERRPSAHAPCPTEVRLSPDGTFVSNGTQDTAGFRNERHRQLAVAIRQRIESRLGGRVRNLAVRVTGNTIVLEGNCATYYTKQLAQHAALGVLNDEQLENAIAVIVPR